MYNDSNSSEDRAKESHGSERRHAGTGEGISARIHVANSRGDRAENGRRSDRRHSANSLWERDDSCMLMATSIVVAYVRVGGVRGSTEVGSRLKSRNEEEPTFPESRNEGQERTASVGVNPLIAPMVAIGVNEAASCSTERPNRPRT